MNSSPFEFDEIELLNWSNKWLADNCPPNPILSKIPTYDLVEYKIMTLEDLHEIKFNEQIDYEYHDTENYNSDYESDNENSLSFDEYSDEEFYSDY
tara:strand:- start:192 stop:479 length:288 start_codon:yes stop_codon:yes gene_type:complete